MKFNIFLTQLIKNLYLKITSSKDQPKEEKSSSSNKNNSKSANKTKTKEENPNNSLLPKAIPPNNKKNSFFFTSSIIFSVLVLIYFMFWHSNPVKIKINKLETVSSDNKKLKINDSYTIGLENFVAAEHTGEKDRFYIIAKSDKGKVKFPVENMKTLNSYLYKEIFSIGNWIIANNTINPTRNLFHNADANNKPISCYVTNSDLKKATTTTSATSSSQTTLQPSDYCKYVISEINSSKGTTTTYDEEFIKNLFTFLRTSYQNRSFPSNITFSNIFFSLLPTLLYIGVFMFIFKSISQAQGGGIMGKSDSIFNIGNMNNKPFKSDINFNDVAGIQEEKEELIEIVDYLKNPEKYQGMGARTPRGVMLYGPPGTGKTLLAKAVSGEASVPFFEVSGSNFDDMFVGVGAKRIRNLFKQAKKHAPCIIFIDEIDAVAGKRSNKNFSSSGSIDQTINQLLSEMDGFNTCNGIVIIAATNRLDTIDEAILRPGRFDRHIQITLPDINERKKILELHASNKNLSQAVNLENIARRTPGFSGAQLENILNEATLLAVRKNLKIIGYNEIDEAIDRVIAGPAKKSRKIFDEEKIQIAYHEAGHAIAGLYVKGGNVVEKITIIPRGQAAGYMLSAPEKQELLIQRKDQLLANVTTTLAGRASEEIYFGKDKITAGASNDFLKVTAIVRSMVTQLGMSNLGLRQFELQDGENNPYMKPYSEKTAEKIDIEIDRIINEQYTKALYLVQEHKEELKLIVESLLLLETIVKTHIDYIHQNKQLPQDAINAKLKLKKDDKPKKI